MGKPGPTSDRSCSGALSRHIVHRVAMHVPIKKRHFDAVVPKMAKQTFAFPASTRTMFLNWKVKPIAIHDEKMRHAKKVRQYYGLLAAGSVGAHKFFAGDPRQDCTACWDAACWNAGTCTGLDDGCACAEGGPHGGCTSPAGGGCKPGLKCALMCTSPYCATTGTRNCIPAYQCAATGQYQIADNCE